LDDLKSGRIIGLVLFILLILFSVYYFTLAPDITEGKVITTEKKADEMKNEIIQDLDTIGDNLNDIEGYFSE